MPSLKSSRKATMPTPSTARPDNQLEGFAVLGAAIALADLAEAKGMTVEAVSGFPALLAEAGLPSKIGPTLGHAAHRIYRDRIDAMLYRCNRPTNQPTPVLTRPQAEKIIDDAERQAATVKAVERAKAVEAAQPKKERPVADAEAPVVCRAVEL